MYDTTNIPPDLWREIARDMLAMEAKLRPLHHPPSTGCIVLWRNEERIGMIQPHPMADEHPAIVLISITSKYRDRAYVNAVRELDPGRLELKADSRLDLNGNHHVLHRNGDFLTFMTKDETAAMDQDHNVVMEVHPGHDGGLNVKAIVQRDFQQEPEPPSGKVH